MDVGKPKRIVTVEPVEDPVPREKEPEKISVPAPSEPARREPEHVPADV